MRGIILASGLIFLPVTAHAQNVTMATEASFPPFSQTEADGSYTGLEIDLGNAVCEHLGWNCTWVQQDFDGAIAALLAGQFDVIFSSMSITAERAEVADFSIPYYSTPTAFFGASDASFSPPSELGGRTIGIYGGSTQQEYAEENYSDVTLRQYENIDQMGADLQAGRIDAMFVEQIAGLNWSISDDASGYGQIGDIVSVAEFGGKGAGAMFRQGEDNLREAVNSALRALYADGSFDEISARWLPEGASVRADDLWTN
jgi:ABC-type amino acid transport substrate-binding protein